MERHSISHFMLIVAVAALYSLSFHGSCATSEAKEPAATDTFTNRAIRVDLIQRDSPISHFIMDTDEMQI